MNLVFIRHGDPDYEHDTLTEKGKIQAQKLGEYIKDWKVDEVYNSPLGRAKLTAAYATANWDKKPQTLDMISEIVWGNIGGKPYDSPSPWTLIDKHLEENHSYPLDDSWKQIPDFAKNTVVQDCELRCQLFDDFLKAHGYTRKGQLYLVEEPNDKNIVFICHGGVSATLISHLLNIPYLQFNAHIGLGVTSISKMRLSGTKGEYVAAKLDYLNDTTHLNK